jgi:ferritin
MISGDLRKLLIAQIGSELAAHQLYMAISTYFDRASLKAWGKLFRDQSVEEAQHAQKIMDFLTDNEIEFDLPALKSTATRFSSPLAAAQRALQSERDVAAQFDKMAAVATGQGDHRGHQFLQWFIEEQVEEEAKLVAIVDLIESGINLFQAEAVLDRFE